MQRDHPEEPVAVKIIGKEAGEKWKAMSMEEKEPYETLSTASKQEYARMKQLTPAERIMVLAAQAMNHTVSHFADASAGLKFMFALKQLSIYGVASVFVYCSAVRLFWCCNQNSRQAFSTLIYFFCASEILLFWFWGTSYIDIKTLQGSLLPFHMGLPAEESITNRASLTQSAAGTCNMSWCSCLAHAMFGTCLAIKHNKMV